MPPLRLLISSPNILEFKHHWFICGASPLVEASRVPPGPVRARLPDRYHLGSRAALVRSRHRQGHHPRAESHQGVRAQGSRREEPVPRRQVSRAPVGGEDTPGRETSPMCRALSVSRSLGVLKIGASFSALNEWDPGRVGTVYQGEREGCSRKDGEGIPESRLAIGLLAHGQLGLLV